MPDVTLETVHDQTTKILAALDNICADLIGVKEEQLVTNAMLRALESSQQAMFTQLTVMARQFARMNDRVSRLEDAAGGAR